MTLSEAAEQIRERMLADDQVRVSIALFGQPGCGKSSLIKAISGAVIPDDGSIRLNGSEVRSVPQSERAIRGWAVDLATAVRVENPSRERRAIAGVATPLRAAALR